MACVDSVPVSGASISVMTPSGQRATVHASDIVAARLEDLQFDLGEGPGLDAFTRRLPISAADLDDPVAGSAQWWPAFTPAARRLGVRAIFAFPLLLGAAELGVLLLYRTGPDALDAAQHARALRLADAAFFGALDLLSGSVDDGDHTRWDGGAPLHRAEAYQAAGMLMAQLDVTVADATVRLRAHAYAVNRPVIDVARDIIEGRLRLQGDNGPLRPDAQERS